MSGVQSTIGQIRAASRQLVRELGFMGGDFAGTDLPPSSVHALIEIDSTPGITARDLGERLRLEKSSVSRMLRKLVQAGHLIERADARDGRAKKLFLSETGIEKTKAIHAFAKEQVANALARLSPGQAETIVEGLRLYADALGSSAAPAPARIEIAEGYRTGIIARITQMHAHHYGAASGFGQRFESVVAGGLAAFCDRLDDPRNALWYAIREGEIVGSVAIDGEDMGDGIAHLRWFIVDDGVRGRGVGRSLLAAALAFVDAGDFAQTQLWTFSGLTAARRLYEAHGFTCVEEQPGDQWGREVLEQRFARPSTR